MRIALTIVCTLCLAALLCLALPFADGQAPSGGMKLPGARAVIDAADFSSLQAALDALPDEGGVVQLPPGTFEISQPLVLEKGDVLLRGSGTATHIVNQNNDGQSALVIRPRDAQTNTRERIWRVQLSDLRITGNEQSGHGIEAVQVNEIYLDGVTVSYHGRDGIRLDRCYEDPRICDSLITYNKDAGVRLLGCHDIVVVGNQFEENLDALVCADGFNLCMTGNNIDDHLRHGVVIENTYGSVVSGNMIEECQGTGIVLDRDCYGITLAANVIAHDFGGGIDLRDAHGCTVSANSFPLCGKFGLAIGPASARNTVTGNTFSDSYIGDGLKRTREDQNYAAGILLDGTSDVTITGNSLAGLATKALVLSDSPSRRVVFTGNVVVGLESDHARLVDSQVDGNIVTPPSSATPGQ